MANSFKKLYLINEHDYKMLQELKQGSVQKPATTHQRDIDVKNALSMNKRLETYANERSRKDHGRAELPSDETSMEHTTEDNTNASYAPRVEDSRPSSLVHSPLRPASPIGLPPLEPTPKKNTIIDDSTPLASSSPVSVTKIRTRATTPLDASYHSLSINKTSKKKTSSHESKPVGTRSPKDSIYKIISDYIQSPTAANEAIDLAKAVLDMPSVHIEWDQQQILLGDQPFTLMQFIDIIQVLTVNIKPSDDVQKLYEFVDHLKTNFFPINMIQNTYVKLMFSTSRKGSRAMPPQPRSPVTWFNSLSDARK